MDEQESTFPPPRRACLISPRPERAWEEALSQCLCWILLRDTMKRPNPMTQPPMKWVVSVDVWCPGDRIEAEEGVVYSTISKEDCEAVSSSYESYDEEEVSKGKSSHAAPVAVHRGVHRADEGTHGSAPSSGGRSGWASGPNSCAIVLGLQSKEQTQQWLKAIQEISSKSVEGTEVSHYPSESPRLICTHGEVGERYSVASESGSSTDSHTETPENKDVKKKHGPGLKFSNLMNIGKKKTSSLDSPEKSVDISGFLNVLVNSQWRARWCLIKNGQLCFYQDKAKTKVAQQPLPLAGCVVLPDPSPDHLYSFRIQQDGEQLATLEAKSSADMGHWLGLLLSQTGSKTDPEDLTYDYVDSERISCIINAARTSMYLMQRRFSEPNAYTDNLPVVSNVTDDIYDDVATTELELEESQESGHEGSRVEPGLKAEPDTADRLYLDLIPVRSFLHPSGGQTSPQHPRVASPTPRLTEEPTPLNQVVSLPQKDPEPPCSSTRPPHSIKSRARSAKSALPSTEAQRRSGPGAPCPQYSRINTEVSERTRPTTAGLGSIEVKLGKNRTEADVRRFSEERDRLEREKEEVRNTLAALRLQRRELKEALTACRDLAQQRPLEARVKEAEEACREEERRRVELELQLVDVKESLKKVEAGPFTLGTAVDCGLLDTVSTSTPKAQSCTSPAAPSSNCTDTSPVNSATALKSRPLSIMAPSKGNVLQKTKEWEKKATT
ncbi:hypothetical protein SKAU_G00140110 [Synaphobranchus kaupii]|uniref:PH domain-containing protein n=1 Tax=Synaphobranchus kaupii TaxID=118154 RepID=A0A9Q1J4C1_SYNKA|nr:hypothetical protein SKAU_G00140110 [Synaphobranchus kaupii]